MFDVKQSKCITQSTIINLRAYEYSQELHYCPFAVNLNRCAGIWNALNIFSSRVCFPNGMKD